MGWARGGPCPERPIPDVPPALTRAVAWRALTRLHRRHPEHDLRLVMRHPGHGGYDVLSLLHLPGPRPVLGLHLGAGTAHWHRRLTPGADPVPRAPEPFLAPGLAADRDALYRTLATGLGLPVRTAPPAPSAPSSLALAVIAELLERVALGERAVHLLPGWFDSTGADVGPLPWAEALPALARQPRGSGEEARMLAAIRYWGLDRSPDAAQPAVVVDVATATWWHHGRAAGDLHRAWSEGAGVRGLAWLLEVALDHDTGPVR